MGSVFDRKVVLSWQIWLLVKSPYKLIKLGIFQMSITSSKISFGTQFKAHIGANHAARHLRLKKLGNKQKKEKVVQGALTSTVWIHTLTLHRAGGRSCVFRVLNLVVYYVLVNLNLDRLSHVYTAVCSCIAR